MRLLPAAVLAALVAAAALAAPGGAQDECRGIQACIPVSGPWVVVPGGVETRFLLSCGKRGVIGGIDALATTSDVRVGFDGRLGSPVSPGVTTTSSAFFRARLVRGVRGAFQPWLGCIPAAGGGGRSTVSARMGPGPSLDRVARIVVVSPGEVKTAAVRCPLGERLIGGWHAVAFRTKKPPRLADAARVHAGQEVEVREGDRVARASTVEPQRERQRRRHDRQRNEQVGRSERHGAHSAPTWTTACTSSDNASVATTVATTERAVSAWPACTRAASARRGGFFVRKATACQPPIRRSPSA
jgi:hypothetical protein